MLICSPQARLTQGGLSRARARRADQLSRPVATAAPVLFPLAKRRVFVAGHGGMVGSALTRRLAGIGCEVLTAGRGEVDLRRQEATEAWLRAQRPDAVFVAAATVGGILANDTLPAEFLYDNLMIAGN